MPQGYGQRDAVDRELHNFLTPNLHRALDLGAVERAAIAVALSGVAA